MNGLADISITHDGVRVDREVCYQNTPDRQGIKKKRDEELKATDKIKKYMFLQKASVDEVFDYITDTQDYLSDRDRQSDDALAMVIKQVTDFLTDSEELVRSIIKGDNEIAKLADGIERLNKIDQQLDWASSTLNLSYESRETIEKVKSAFYKIQAVFNKALSEFRKGGYA